MAKVLIAGEDEMALNTLRAELEAEGHDVRQVGDGYAAYEAALSDTPDLVFLELEMPVFNARETCARLRGDPTLPPTLPILVLTPADSDRRSLLHAGATDFLPKQHEAHALRELVAGFLR